MILKRNFNPIKVIGYVKKELIISLITSILVFINIKLNLIEISLPFSVTATLGSALAIFIAFRNNSSYSRWWEARTAWAGIQNSSRILARLVITFTDSHKNQNNYDEKRSEKFKIEMINLIIIWAYSLKNLLRKEDNTNLKNRINPETYERIKDKNNEPNYLQLIMGQKIYEAMSNGTLAGFDSFQLEGQLSSLANFQSSCEKIKNTPLLRQYDYFTRIFLFTFISILPISLVNDFVKMDIINLLIPVSFIISFVFSIIGKVGEVNEDPFENRITDVPITTICNSIEIELLEMIGSQDLPLKIEENNGYLF